MVDHTADNDNIEHDYDGDRGHDHGSCHDHQHDDGDDDDERNDGDDDVDDLNKKISIKEILRAVKSLKRHKSAGSDCLINEYFI